MLLPSALVPNRAAIGGVDVGANALDGVQVVTGAPHACVTVISEDAMLAGVVNPSGKPTRKACAQVLPRYMFVNAAVILVGSRRPDRLCVCVLMLPAAPKMSGECDVSG